ncbi:MAG: hypothetical protein AAGI25_04860 [Bacteroidota bacterium]
MNSSYDELQHIANHDTLIRGIMGVLPSDLSRGKEYSYQNIYDHIALLDEGLLQELNEVMVAMGHEGLPKKEKTAEGGVALPCKTDSFVVKTATHFPPITTCCGTVHVSALICVSRFTDDRFFNSFIIK